MPRRGGGFGNLDSEAIRRLQEKRGGDYGYAKNGRQTY
jgi:hypothetical protein